MFFKYLEAHDKESEITLILKISPNDKIDIYINNEEIEDGKISVTKLKSINGIFDEIKKCETRTIIKNFIITPTGVAKGI